MLPDDVLIKIFDFYVDEDMGEDFEKQRLQEWMTLVRVCRRWRSLVFQSPRRLNLRLVCTPKTPPRDTLDIWPPLRLIIHDTYEDGTSGVDNTIAALEHNDRVCQIDLICSYPRMKYVTDSAAMHKPFPELTHLELVMISDNELTIPDSFLGGSAPRLRSVNLINVPFPGLPKLLSSATHLVNLDLSYIPLSGYISPDSMATSLSALTSLEFLRVDFGSARPVPGSRCQAPLTRSILPVLTTMLFGGVSEYLEEILARIDAPRLSEMHITFFDRFIFDTPQLFQVINQSPALRTPEKCHIAFYYGTIIVKFPSQTSDLGVLSVSISFIESDESDWRLSSLEQVCTSSLPLVSTLEDLYILEGSYTPLRWLDDVENTLWLQLLQPFFAVKNLYLCKKSVPRIVPTLEELIGARMTEVLPALESIFLEELQPSGPFNEGIEKFVAARRLTSHPVTVSRWDKDWE